MAMAYAAPRERPQALDLMNNLGALFVLSLTTSVARQNIVRIAGTIVSEVDNAGQYVGVEPRNLKHTLCAQDARCSNPVNRVIMMLSADILSIIPSV